MAAKSCLDAALAYVGRGWAVLPVRAGSKVPLTKHGVRDAATNEATIRAWWDRWPSAGVAIACGAKSGGLVALDVDGERGAKSLRALENEFGPLLATWRVKTGRGQHIYFRCAEATATQQLAPGLELRGEGAYVLAPPSIHPSGTRYEVIENADLTPLPDALRKILTPVADKGAAPEINVADTPQLSEGVRQLIETDAKVGLRWHGDPLGLGDTTRSGIDFSLASLLAHRDCSDAEIAGALRLAPYNAKRQQELTPQYLERTIVRARSDKPAGQVAVITAVAESATETLAAPISLAECKSQIAHWLAFAPGEELAVDVACATKLANEAEGDPVFLVLLGPSSGAKTEILRAFHGAPGVYALGSLTARTFASGLDPKKASLLSRLSKDVHTLVIKDLGAILSMSPNDRGDLLQQLRDIFDGYFRRDWGSGKGALEWEGRLGLLAGATPALEREFSTLAALGERFLFFRMSVGNRAAQASRAIEACGREREMRIEIRNAITSAFAEVSTERLNEAVVLDEAAGVLRAIACVITQARTPVCRDRFDKTIEYLPQLEGPARAVKQLKKLAQALSLLYGSTSVGDDELAVVAKIGADRIPSLRSRVVGRFFRTSDEVTAKQLGQAVHIPTGTAARLAEDLSVLGILSRRAKSDMSNAPFLYRLRPEFRQLLVESAIGPVTYAVPCESADELPASSSSAESGGRTEAIEDSGDGDDSL